MNWRRADDTLICNFLAHCFTTGISHSTAHVYVSAINHLFDDAMLPSPTGSRSVVHALQGYKRRRTAPPDSRLPITYDILKRLKFDLRTADYCSHDRRVFWTACVMAFFGYLRVSEYCTAYAERQSPADLRLGDLTVRSDEVILTLRSSKTDPFREGQRVALRPTGRSICPVSVVHALISSLKKSRLRQPRSPVLTFADGSFLSCSRFRHFIKRMMAYHPEGHRFGTHSFRIGAATTAALIGQHPDEIKRAGRWKSNVYAGYIRPQNTVGLRLE